MVVKIVSENCVRHTDCISAIIVPEIEEDGAPWQQCSIVYLFESGADFTFPLSKGDKIFYLNDEGKTIDKNVSMCYNELKVD